MAGVLNSLASYVTKMLADMVREEVAMMIGVSSGIDDLSIKLRDLNNFLADADRRNITDEGVREWVEELKRALYLATDILDLCQLKVMEDGPSKDMGCLNPLLFCMRNPLHAHDIGSRIKILTQKLDDIYKRGVSFSFIKLEAYEHKMTPPQLFDRKTDPLLERLGVVGEKLKDDTRELVNMLTKEVADGSDSITVLSIVGVGGIGKTTLAKNVFNDEVIQGKFTEKIWLSITKEYTELELLRTAIAFVNGEIPTHGGGTGFKALLVLSLAEAIKDKKFFLVLDDMWGDSGWNNLLKSPFSYGAPGSRVLITTRHVTVARGMKVVHYHHVHKLGPEDAWSLLKKQVLISEKTEDEVDMLKDIGLHIIAKCDGLPLAIKVLGGLLCKKEKTRRDWEDVLNNDIWSVSRMPEELNYAIYLSYEDLPPFLKQCFLHFSLKPKKIALTVSNVVSMWIGEGLVHGDSGSLEEEGKKYYKELILRNLIEIDTEKYVGQFICNMHDVILSFAQFVAKDEALVTHSGDTAKKKLASHKFLRLSIETNEAESQEFEWRFLRDQTLLRTLVLVGNFSIQSGSLITFSSLRTLYVESTSFAALIECVCQLKHLRYLSVRNCTDLSRLPKNIHTMKFLQYLDLKGCEGIVELPDSIVMLQELRYLNIENTHVSRIPKGFGALTNLRTLCGFPTYMDGDWCSLEELGPLSQLMDLGLKGLETATATSSIVKARLDAKPHLAILGLKCIRRLGDDGWPNAGVFEEEKNRIEMVFDVLCPLACLEHLCIDGYYGRQLPRWMMWTETAPLKNLRLLFMEYLACCTQLPDGLCRLPCLELVVVFRAPAIKRVGHEFLQPYHHHQHAPSQAVVAFPRLNKMILDEMLEWEEWEWEEQVQAMPSLEELRIQSCKLRCIPPGFAFQARSLKKLNIRTVKGLQSIENFASVVELKLYNSPDLIKISNFPKLQKLDILYCQNLESLQDMNALRRLWLRVSNTEKKLPLYLQTVNPIHLLLDRCNGEVLASMAAAKYGSEWDKFSHIQCVEAYADDGDIEKKWQLLYTREPYSMQTSIILEEWQ